MKIRNGFVSNSSSSSYLVATNPNHEPTRRHLKELIDWCNESNKEIAKHTGTTDAYSIKKIANFYNLTLFEITIEAGVCGIGPLIDMLNTLNKDFELKIVAETSEGIGRISHKE